MTTFTVLYWKYWFKCVAFYSSISGRAEHAFPQPVHHDIGGKCSLLTSFEGIHSNLRMFLVISSTSSSIYGKTDVIIVWMQLRFKTRAGSSLPLRVLQV